MRLHKPLHFSDYANDIKLFEPYHKVNTDGYDKEKLVSGLLDFLRETNQGLERVPGKPFLTERQLLYGSLNTLAPHALNSNAIQQLNRLLQLELKEKAITDCQHPTFKSHTRIGDTEVSVWKGDITTLNTDAIVNAANNQMLGCFQPMHACIDNAIHSAAGVQLRDDCNTVMEKQGFAEPTGTAKITRAYNLPSKFVLHTVGPIVHAQVTEKIEADLARAYTACLEICREIPAIKSIAFCGISTGVFGYPPDQAAQVALGTVSSWLENNKGCLDRVVFNVFTDKDETNYNNLVDKR